MKCWMILAIFSICTFFSVFSVANGGGASKIGHSLHHSESVGGGIYNMTEIEFEEPMFKEAITELLKKLDGVNHCHAFELVKIVESSRQVVSGMKYDVKLQVKPVFDGSGKIGCSCPCYSKVGGIKEVKASVWSQLWLKKDRHKVTFKADRDFDENGKMALS